MTDPGFYETRMGRTYYEHTVPELVRQLEMLNQNLGRLIETQTQGDETDGHDTRTEEETQPPQP